MSEEIEETPVDQPPKSGEWVDSEEFFKHLTDDEIAEGEFEGFETPDVDYVEVDGKRLPVELLGDDD